MQDLLRRAHRLHRHPHDAHAEEEDEGHHGHRLHGKAKAEGEDARSEARPVGHLLRFPERVDTEGIAFAAGEEEEQQAKEDIEPDINAEHDAGILPSTRFFLGLSHAAEDVFVIGDHRFLELAILEHLVFFIESKALEVRAD